MLRISLTNCTYYFPVSISLGIIEALDGKFTFKIGKPDIVTLVLDKIVSCRIFIDSELSCLNL